MAKTEKSKAELYREERKARLAKAAKKKSKKGMGKGTKAVVSVLIVLALVLGIGGGVAISQGFDRQLKKVLTIDGVGEVSQAEYTYYYSNVYNRYYNMAQQYEQYYQYYYGAGYGKIVTGGFDYTKAPDLQKLDKDHADYEEVVAAGYAEPTWADYFDVIARKQIASVKVINSLAKAAGFKLDDETQASIDKEYKELKEAAGKQRISTNKYLSTFIGKGVTSSLYKKILKEQHIAEKYEEILLAQYRDGLTAEEIEKGYTDNKTAYDVASFSYYLVAAEKVKVKEDGKEKETVTTKTMKAAKEKAEALIASAANREELEKAIKEDKKDGKLQDMNGVTASTVEQYIGEETAKWLFETKDLKVGDMKTFKIESSGYLVCCVSELPHRVDTKMVNLRVIEVKVPEEKKEDEKSDKEMTEEEKEKAEAEKAEAEKKAAEEAAKRAEADKNTPALDTFKDAPVYNVIEKKTSNKDAYLDAEIILRKYLAGERTEEAFAALANENGANATSDSSLYKNVYPNSGMVDGEVEDWAFAEGRKPGDVGIVECKGEAYYIVYFVEELDESNWEMNVKDNLAAEKVQDQIDSYAVTVKNAPAVQKVITEVMDYAKKVVASNANDSLSLF